MSGRLLSVVRPPAVSVCAITAPGPVLTTTDVAGPRYVTVVLTPAG